MTEPSDLKARPSGLATASLVFSMVALGLLGLALPVTVAGSPDAGAMVSAVLTAASALCGAVSVLLLLATGIQFVCAREKRAGYVRAWISFGLILLESIALGLIASKWADRFFKW
jgi:hypothetical protein